MSLKEHPRQKIDDKKTRNRMEILAGKKTKKKNEIDPGKKKREIANTLLNRHH